MAWCLDFVHINTLRNYGRISLILHISKVLLNLILERVRAKVKYKMEQEHQDSSNENLR